MLALARTCLSISSVCHGLLLSLHRMPVLREPSRGPCLDISGSTVALGWLANIYLHPTAQACAVGAPGSRASRAGLPCDPPFDSRIHTAGRMAIRGELPITLLLERPHFSRETRKCEGLHSSVSGGPAETETGRSATRRECPKRPGPTRSGSAGTCVAHQRGKPLPAEVACVW